MPTAEKRVKMDPMKCMVCQGSLGMHPMKVKVKKRVGRICNRVDKEHAEWLLDRNMDSAYLRITYRRRGGILGIIILMVAFIVPLAFLVGGALNWGLHALGVTF